MRAAPGSAALLALLAGCAERATAPAAETLRIGGVLGGAPAGFAAADAPVPLRFPRDHGPHRAFRSEWWYFTGNLATDGGRRFGFQLTFFRAALSPQPPERPSAWATAQVWMAHFAVTDVEGARMHAFERFSRDALGLAGARAAPFAVWIDDWSARATGEGFAPLRLRAEQAGIGLALDLAPGKPPVLQGERGLSRKSAAHASYYYSLTRLPAAGTVRVGGQQHRVRGEAWCDREWSTSALADDQVGWDWLALQLDDGHELMFYRLRRRDGTTDPFSAGVLVPPRGAPTALAHDDVRLATMTSWTSPDGRATYPVALRVTGAGLDLRVEPLVLDQELRLGFRYWEGAVRARGTHGGRDVGGFGYLELTGYGGE